MAGTNRGYWGLIRGLLRRGSAFPSLLGGALGNIGFLETTVSPRMSVPARLRRA